MTYTLTIPAWRPALLNEMHGAWQKRARLKKADREMVTAYARLQDIPMAACKRQVDLLVYLGKGERRWDKDAPWKSLLDSLVCCGLLVDDSENWVEQGKVTFIRLKPKDDAQRRCEIVLEDLEEEA